MYVVLGAAVGLNYLLGVIVIALVGSGLLTAALVRARTDLVLRWASVASISQFPHDRPSPRVSSLSAGGRALAWEKNIIFRTFSRVCSKS